jgi:hypothetical protein
MPITRNARIVRIKPTWLTVEADLVYTETQVGSQIAFTVPSAIGVLSLQLQIMVGGEALTAPIAVALDDPAPIYVRDAASVGETVYGIWNAITSAGAELAPLLTEVASATTEPGGGGPDWSWVSGLDLSTDVDWEPLDGSNGWVTTGRRGVATVASTLDEPPSGFIFEGVRGVTAIGETPTPPASALQPFVDAVDALFPDLEYGVTGDTWTSSGGALVGYTNDFHIYAKHSATGERRLINSFSFVAEPEIDPGDPGTEIDTINVNATGGDATAAWNDAIAKAQARITAGTAGKYVIGLPTYDYGEKTVTLKAGASQEIVFKSIQDDIGSGIAGAKIRRLTLNKAENLSYSFINFDREGVSPNIDAVVKLIAAKNIGLRHSQVRLKAKPAGGFSDLYVAHPTTGKLHLPAYNISGYGIHITGDGTTGSSGVEILEVAIYGPFKRALGGSMNNVTVRRCIWAEINADNVQMGGASGYLLENNWFARNLHPEQKPDGSDWVHCDMHQMDANWSNSDYVFDGVVLRGNVGMLSTINSGALKLPYQGLFTSDAHNRNVTMEDNIIITSTVTGAGFGDNKLGLASGNIARRNTLLPLVDWDRQSGFRQGTWIYQRPGMVPSQSVQNAWAATAAILMTQVTNSLKIVVEDYNFAAVNEYYENARRFASFYDARPVAGKATHYSYSGGTKMGAYQTYERVIEDKVGMPRAGRARWIWEADYNHLGQIDVP